MIRPDSSEYPGRATPTLYGVYIDYGRRAVEFCDTYPSSEQAKKAREDYICDCAVISKISAEDSARTHQSVISASADEGGSRTLQLALIFRFIYTNKYIYNIYNRNVYTNIYMYIRVFYTYIDIYPRRQRGVRNSPSASQSAARLADG